MYVFNVLALSGITISGNISILYHGQHCPIQHLWDLLIKCTQQRPATPQTLQQLLSYSLWQKWQRIPQATPGGLFTV